MRLSLIHLLSLRIILISMLTIALSLHYRHTHTHHHKVGTEAQLDVEYIMAIAPGAETFFYSMGDYNPSNPPDANTTNEGDSQLLLYRTIVSTPMHTYLTYSLSNTRANSYRLSLIRSTSLHPRVPAASLLAFIRRY
jgi:hypothetical protein